MNHKDRHLLLRAFDEDLSTEERHDLSQLLAASSEARTEFEALRDLRRTFATAEPPAFSPFFADRVMRRVAADRAADRNRSIPLLGNVLTWPGWRLAGSGIALLLIAASLGWVLWLRPHTVTAPYGATRSLTLPDGSVVELASGATLSYARTWGRTIRNVRLIGEAFFDVRKQPIPFVVVTFNARIEVKGTRFNVRAWPQEEHPETAVALASGLVEVSSRRDREHPILLRPGEATAVVGDAPTPHAPSVVSLDRVLAWRTGGIAFTDAPLPAVLREIERRFDVEVHLASPRLASQRLTILDPAPSSASEVLSDICHALNLRYRRTAQGYEILGQ